MGPSLRLGIVLLIATVVLAGGARAAERSQDALVLRKPVQLLLDTRPGEAAVSIFQDSNVRTPLEVPVEENHVHFMCIELRGHRMMWGPMIIPPGRHLHFTLQREDAAAARLFKWRATRAEMTDGCLHYSVALVNPA